MGLSKATQDRRRSRHRVGPPADPAARPVPVNRLSDAESAELIAVLNSQRFVDRAPPQIYATLLAEGKVSVFDFHDIPDPGAEPAGQGPSPAGHASAAEGPGTAGHRAAAGVQLGHHQTRRAGEGPVFRLLT